MPPAATTGVGDTASTTAGTSGIVATMPLTWPPASHPWAMTISTPQSTARLASMAEPTVCMTIAPPAFARGTREDGSRQKKEMIGDSLFETDLEALLLRKIKIQVDPERPRRQSAHLPDLPPHCVRVGTPEYQHAKPACVADGGRERGADRAAHRRLNDGQLNSQTLAKNRLHPPRLRSRVANRCAKRR